MPATIRQSALREYAGAGADTQLEQRVGHNKATCALANKLARICWAVWKYESDFDSNRAVA